MEKVKTALRIQRIVFDRIYDAITEVLSKPRVADIIELQGNFYLLNQKMEIISDLGSQLFELLLESENSTDTITEAVVLESDEYSKKYHKLKLQVENFLQKVSADEVLSSKSLGSSQSKRKLKLPTIEFKKFGGDIKEWLSFWSQFKRIHEDDDIENEDKFQYLIQATIPSSRARQLVDSYPPSEDNYPKVIDSLKNRFGRDDLLVEVYVRELLKLILTNLDTRANLSFLYDKMESQLRALDTLGVTSDTCAAMLYPLVESCLPEELIRVWQRSSSYDSDSTLKIRLDKLMLFLRREVENEERISLATSGFNLPNKSRKSDGILQKNEGVPTASDLINKSFRKCTFCGGQHPTENCMEAKKWTLDERKKKLTDTGCCYSCTKFGHISRRCRVYLKCSNCSGRHVTILCPKSEVEQKPEDEQLASPSTSVEKTLSNHTYSEVFLQTMVVRLNGNNKNRRSRIIIDTGSQRSYITKNAVNEMEYSPIREEEMIHALFGGTETNTRTHTCYRVRLGSLQGSYCCNFEVLDQDIICSNVTSVKKGPWIDELKFLGIEISDTRDGPIDVLIGADIAGKLFTGNRHELICGLVAMETLLGWTLMGKAKIHSNEPCSSSMFVTSMFVRNMNVADLWNLDVLGIKDPTESMSQKEIEEAIMSHFLKTVSRMNDGRYEVHMPWIEGHPPLPSNFEIACKRLDNLKKKLDNDGYYSEYKQVFTDWLNESIIEEVPELDLHKPGHYLPHRHVVKLSSATTKIRPVFDASAKERNQPSLNQCLEKGINFIELIPSILIRFRWSKIGVVADIRKAFLQIGLTLSDRDFLRFLWYDEIGNWKVFRHARVVFGVTCSPFLLGAVIEYHLRQTLKENVSYCETVILKLLKSFYVDNCVTSVDTEQELQQFIEQSTKIMAEGQFELRAWEYSLLNEDHNVCSLSPVLGLNWNKNFDTLEISGEWFKTINTDVITKRTILSAANKLFDPIGFSCPVSLCPKLLLQRTWLSEIGWDTEVEEEVKKNFLEWVKELPLLQNLKIPRWLLNSIDVKKTCSLHVFCDSSKDAYATAIFIRSESSNGVHVQLVQARSRLAPVKRLSIPRLELLAATIGARLFKNVIENLDPNFRVYFWSDSTTVLYWIKNDDQWKSYVWNRVQEIRKLTKKEEWFYVPGNLNPADLPSRGCSVKYLFEVKWWEGPLWLRRSPEEWPKQIYSCDKEDINKEKKAGISSSFLSAERDKDYYSWYYTYFSNYERILRLVAWVRRFINNCKNKNSRKTDLLCIEEIEKSEKIIFKLIQEEAFPDGLENTRILSLCSFRDEDGVIRIKTKVSDRQDTTDYRYPVILPSEHLVVQRLILAKHVEFCHVGVQGLLSILRERFWILRGRKCIKSVVSKCTVCRRFTAVKFDAAAVPLPESRVRDASIFEVTGVDLAGPLYIRNGRKVWVCLFTCAVYRAIHMEIVSSISTDSFLLALRRFVARRGRPSIIYSDNGTNFVGTENYFAELDWTKISEYSTARRIDWRFNPPTASWWGGFWERLIRIVKDLLRKILGKASLNLEELSTIICDCEFIINSRPLTYLSEDSQDLIALTPAMFLHEIKEVGVPDIDAVEAESCRRHWRYRQKLKHDLRKRFRNEYLGQMSLYSKKIDNRAIKKGDIVFIGNDNTKRLDWPLALVIDLIPGRDGKSRVALLKTAKGNLLRPLQRIYSLEVDHNELSTHQIKVDKLELVPDVAQQESNSVEDNQPEVERKSNTSEKKVTCTRYGREVKPPSRFTF